MQRVDTQGGSSDSPRGLWEARAAGSFSDLPLHQHFFPNAISCSGGRQEGLRKLWLLPEPTATPRASSAQSKPGFNLLPTSHAACKIFQGVALFPNDYMDCK